MFEIITFRLAEGVDESVFRTVDGRVQVEFAYQQPGFLRRTLGRRDETWLVLQIWRTSRGRPRSLGGLRRFRSGQ